MMRPKLVSYIRGIPPNTYLSLSSHLTISLSLPPSSRSTKRLHHRKLAHTLEHVHTWAVHVNVTYVYMYMHAHVHVCDLHNMHL